MDQETFARVVDAQLDICKDVLHVKAEIYSEAQNVQSDRLVQFKRAAALKGTDQVDALSGMMIKHTTLLYDLIADWENTSNEQWDETITDQMNYLLLLKGVLAEEGMKHGE